MVNRDPNIAFRDRHKPKGRYPITIKFTGGEHLVTFTCPMCGYTYDTIFYKGMTLHTKNLKCLECRKAQMDYHID